MSDSDLDLLEHAHEVPHGGAQLAGDVLAERGPHDGVHIVYPVLEAVAGLEGLLETRLEEVVVLEGVLLVVVGVFGCLLVLGVEMFLEVLVVQRARGRECCCS